MSQPLTKKIDAISNGEAWPGPRQITGCLSEVEPAAGRGRHRPRLLVAVGLWPAVEGGVPPPGLASRRAKSSMHFETFIKWIRDRKDFSSITIVVLTSSDDFPGVEQTITYSTPFLKRPELSLLE